MSARKYPNHCPCCCASLEKLKELGKAGEMSSIKCDLRTQFPEAFGLEAPPCEEPQASDIAPGYHRETLKEPLILEPEDWDAQSWATLCKVCGLPTATTERIVLKVSDMQYYIGK